MSDKDRIIEGLMGVIESQRQTNEALIRRLTLAEGECGDD